MLYPDHRAEVERRLDRLAQLWRQERAAAAERSVASRRDTPLARRVARGEALARLEVDDLAVAAGNRTLLWIKLPDDVDPEVLRLGSGDPVRLWFSDPDDAEAVRGVVSRRQLDRFGVLVDGEPTDKLLHGTFNLDVDDSPSTFNRGDAAIRSARQAKPSTSLGKLAEVLFAGAAPGFDAPSIGEAARALDAALNEPQQRAVSRALSARTAAFIHGPPGTGKTRTLVEVVRRAVARGERVLVCAASNAAVDHLGAGLWQAGLPVVRLGHPARIGDGLEARSLDALLSAGDAAQLGQRWMREARLVRRKAYTRFDRGSLSRFDLRAELDEARRLERDARDHQRRAQDALLDQTAVVCATLTGADSAVLGDRRFDLLVVDEATQCPDPLLLVALGRADRVVLAGDPEQLPPTVIDPAAARDGLAETAFERLARRCPEAGTLLEIQHRMHADLMAFSNATRYGGRLVAHPSVVAHRLEDLPGVRADDVRVTPLVLLDTAGMGFSDGRPGDDPGANDASVLNEGQAERTAAEVRRILSRGVRPDQVAVITPYRAQRRLLRQHLAALLPLGLEVDTVDAFQGREREAIVVDLVRSNDEGEVGFVRDRRRLNVALTRARRLLLVVGDTATLAQHADFAAFLEVAEGQGGYLSGWTDEAEPLG